MDIGELLYGPPGDLSVARAFLQQGMWQKASDEMERIRGPQSKLPEVLELRLDVYEHLECWEEALMMSGMLVFTEPERQEWRTRRIDLIKRLFSWETASEALAEDEVMFAERAESQLRFARTVAKAGLADEARRLIRRALAFNPAIRDQVLDDAELSPYFPWE
jgi:uncharacterized protein HemY